MQVRKRRGIIQRSIIYLKRKTKITFTNPDYHILKQNNSNWASKDKRKMVKFFLGMNG